MKSIACGMATIGLCFVSTEALSSLPNLNESQIVASSIVEDWADSAFLRLIALTMLVLGIGMGIVSNRLEHFAMFAGLGLAIFYGPSIVSGVLKGAESNIKDTAYVERHGDTEIKEKLNELAKTIQEGNKEQASYIHEISSNLEKNSERLTPTEQTKIVAKALGCDLSEGMKFESHKNGREYETVTVKGQWVIAINDYGERESVNLKHISCR